MQKEIEKIIIDIIKHELQLPDNYGSTKTGDVIPSVIIYAQNIKLFNTDKIQIAVKMGDAHTYSNRVEYIPDDNGGLIEVQDLNQRQTMQIDVYSRNNEARQRYWEVEAALTSNYAQQMQDLYNFKIGTMANAVNISGIDGSSDINRFSLTFSVLTHYQKRQTIDYYDKFPVEIDGEQGLIAEFNQENIER